MQTTSVDDLKRLLIRIPEARILVVGDVMLDHYIFGEVTRISPEAPVPVLHVQKESSNAGGAANVAINLAGLGTSVRLLSSWGQDEAGNRLANLLEEKAVDLTFCNQHFGLSTISKKRVIARNQQICRIDHEPNSSEYEKFVYQSIDHVSTAIENCNAVIISDYAKGFVTQSLYDEIKRLSDDRGIKVAVDPKPLRPLRFLNPWLMTPNYHESLQLAGLPSNSEYNIDTIKRVCEVIHKKYDPENLVITLGANGMVLSTSDGCQRYFPTVAQEVCDVSGAGDTVIASMVAACISGAEIRAAIDFSNVAAGIVVGKLGTVAINAELISSSLMN